MSRNRNRNRKLTADFGSDELKKELCQCLGIKEIVETIDIDAQPSNIKDTLDIKQVLARL